MSALDNNPNNFLSLNRAYEYTKETLLAFKKDMDSKLTSDQKDGNGGAGGFGGFAGFGGGGEVTSLHWLLSILSCCMCLTC